MADKQNDKVNNSEKLMDNQETPADIQEDETLQVEDGQVNSQDRETEDERPVVEGILDLADGGFGFLRFNNFLTSEKDVYVAPTQIRRFNLKTGDLIKGISRHPKQNERFGALLYVQEVNGDTPIAA